MSSENRRGIGTIEGVALILAILACLTLFLKILPNINSNAQFYNEKFLELQTDLDQVKVDVDNIAKRQGKPQIKDEIKGLRKMVTDLEITKENLPKDYAERVEVVQQEIARLMADLDQAR
ncbi:hypothetical protein JW905_08425 [bacterium]|nr:hypothetical protein [candidate division CSSED10-310 bacterium]